MALVVLVVTVTRPLTGTYSCSNNILSKMKNDQIQIMCPYLLCQKQSSILGIVQSWTSSISIDLIDTMSCSFYQWSVVYNCHECRKVIWWSKFLLQLWLYTILNEEKDICRNKFYKSTLCLYLNYMLYNLLNSSLCALQDF